MFFSTGILRSAAAAWSLAIGSSSMLHKAKLFLLLISDPGRPADILIALLS